MVFKRKKSQYFDFVTRSRAENDSLIGLSFRGWSNPKPCRELQFVAHPEANLLWTNKQLPSASRAPNPTILEDLLSGISPETWIS